MQFLNRTLLIMDRVVDFIVILVQPFFYLLFIAVCIIFIVKPFFRYLTVNKIIREQRMLHKEYQEHKKKIKMDRVAAREKSEEKLHQSMGNGTGKSDAAPNSV